MSEGKWQQVDEHTVQPEAAVRVQKALLQIKGVIEGMIEQEQRNLAVLRERLHKAKHGGGS